MRETGRHKKREIEIERNEWKEIKRRERDRDKEIGRWKNEWKDKCYIKRVRRHYFFFIFFCDRKIPLNLFKPFCDCIYVKLSQNHNHYARLEFSKNSFEKIILSCFLCYIVFIEFFKYFKYFFFKFLDTPNINTPKN